MKKLLVTFALAMVAGITSAQIWQETFSTSAPPTLIQIGAAKVTNDVVQGQWVKMGASVSADKLRLIVNNWGGQQGFPWGASIALDSSLFPAVGNYRLTLDILAMQVDAKLGVRVYNASNGSGGTNNYYRMVNYPWGVNSRCFTDAAGDGWATLLADVELNSSHKGLRSVDFYYDGVGDVVVMLMAISGSSTANRWVDINEVSVDVATPNAAVPSFSAASYNITPAAAQNVAYSNDTFVTDATLNPGLETLYYSAKKNLAPGMNVSSDGIISGTPTSGGTNTLIISVADADGAYDEAVFYLYVDDVNDPPVFNSPPAYGDNQFWAGNGVWNYPYSADLQGYVTDPEGSVVTFSGSGPGWLSIASDGKLSGTPGADDYLANAFQIIASDGSLSSTGTLHIYVEKKNLIHYEDFHTNAQPTVLNTGLAVFPGLGGASMTTTQTLGVWSRSSYGGSSETLTFARPVEGAGGMAGFAIAFDESMFVDGAATYELKFTIQHAAGQAQINYDLYDVDFGASGEVTAGIYAGSSPYTVPAITFTNGASATLITNVFSSAGGNRTIAFDYDGSGDVLFRMCCGSQNPPDWWVLRFDNFKLLGPSLVTPLQTWAIDYDLRGNDAAPDNDADGDGWPMLHEYGLGLNPLDATTAGGAYPTVEVGGSGVIYVHTQRADDSSLTCTLKTNPDLTNPGGWSVGSYASSTYVTGGDYNIVTNTIPATSPNLFIRLEMEE